VADNWRKALERSAVNKRVLPHIQTHGDMEYIAQEGAYHLYAYSLQYFTLPFQSPRFIGEARLEPEDMLEDVQLEPEDLPEDVQ